MGCVGHVDTIVEYHIGREFCFPFKEEFEGIEGVIRICIEEQAKEKVQKDKQRSTNKTKD